jgi:predicted  nucleic acid-binding Zn-ribbon protein
MKPLVQPLAYWQRKLIFILLFLAFLFALPMFMFYATGYRYDIFGDRPSITATGGLYIAAEAPESAIYVDDVEITNARVFRNASYIQGLVPNVHQLHVQSPGRHTWVKQLSVYPHIVTEAEAFNMPLVPQVRPITPYVTVRGEAVFKVATTSETVLPEASTTAAIFLSTTSATSTFRANQEYELLEGLFDEKASTTKAMEKSNKTEDDFGFATTTPTTTLILSTTTVARNNIVLREDGDEVVAVALGTGRQIPHYFCTTQIEQDGALVSETKEQLEGGELMFEETLTELSNNTRECREEIVIDRKGEKVSSFDFLPNNENLVLILRESGLYVTEIDDRVWQNTQPLYQGKDLELLIHNGGIYLRDGELILEIFTDIGAI